jgi:two-component system, sensor histidine kinase and response regulator
MKVKRTVCLRLVLVALCFLVSLSALAPEAKASVKIVWTPSELDFIAAHPEIHLGVDPTFVPYEFFDTDGVYKGIAADYIALISEATGIKMTVTSGLTWDQAYEKAVKKELDVLPCVARTTERDKYFLFSQGYYTFQRVIFISENTKSIKSFDDLKGQRVAVQLNSSHHSFLMDYPTISLALYDTVEEALQAVADGTEIAFVGNLSTSSYLIKKNGITNLRYITISSQTPQQLYFAVRNDWPILVTIINKALISIGQEEKIAISNKWIAIQSGVDYSAVIQTMLIVGGLVALIWSVSLFWIARLRKEITRRKKAQDEANEAKIEAEKANQIKSLFLARMSHEIRTPLSAIIGMAYLIKKTELTVTQGSYLDKLNQSAHNMLSIINDILDFSKIEAGKIEVEKISFDLDKVLQRIANIISVKVEDKTIEFFIHKDPDMPSQFIGDPTRIEQILLNLVNNAVKFTTQGTVSLTVKTLNRNGSKYLVSLGIQDTGIGMSEEQIQKLFVPFDQGDSSISRRFGGTGLGLTIVKNLTELMGGNIQVQSEAGKGSLFTVQLPMEADISQEQAAFKKMATDCFSTVHALVLDASENSRVMLGDCLKAFGIKYTLTVDELQAIQIMRKAAVDGEAPYNLLIVDYMTPQDGGIAFLEKVRKAMYFQRSSKCMLIVPMTREDLLEDISSNGIDFGLTKPIIPSSLYNGIVLLFNINPPSAEPAEAGPESLVSPLPYHILLVEDNSTNQLIAITILESAGFVVSKADNGKEGYDFFANNQQEIDLILMDIHMPVMDGYAATELIRKIDTEIPVIAMTADAIVGVEDKCKSHGFNFYVSKPFEPEVFIRTILDSLKGKPCHGNHQAALATAQTQTASATSEAPEATQEPAQTAEPPAADTPPVEAPAIEWDKAMRQLGLDQKIFTAIVLEFLKENEQTGQLLQGQVDAGAYAEAALTVHKVKSSSGSIGAKDLTECSEKLQKALKANDTVAIREEHARFQMLMKSVLSEIQKKTQA